ncbi:MAG: EAL domain-containing protein [Asticcacaulis sp.]
MRILHRCLCEPLPVDDGEIALTASVGVALYPRDGALREALLNNADLALHRAKGPAADKVCYFDAGTDEAARDRRALAKDLERALRDDEFRIFYQVQQSVATREITGYEALIRWKHPQRGFISPANSSRSPRRAAPSSRSAMGAEGGVRGGGAMGQRPQDRGQPVAGPA